MKTLLILFVAIMVIAASNIGIAQQATPPPQLAPRVLFKAYDGNSPDKMNFQINFSTREPTAFLRLGERIPGTDYKLTKFTHKERPRADRPRELKDASELTIVNTRTGKFVILVLNELVQIPASTPDGGEPK